MMIPDANRPGTTDHPHNAMAFTDHSDAYASIHEDGVNEVISHISYKRPSLVNYASGWIAADPKELLCRPIEVAPEVEDRGNPLVTEMAPVPVIGTDGGVALDFCFQVTKLALDVHPENTVEVSEAADLAIDDQQFGVFVRVCAGLACPHEEVLVELGQPTWTQPFPTTHVPERGPFIPEPDTVHCFCLDAYLTGTVVLRGSGARTSTVSVEDAPAFIVKDVEVAAADFEEARLPEGLREGAECYLQLVVNFALLPRLADAVERIVPMLVRLLDSTLSDTGATLAIETPTAPSIPNNPALEEDELRLFVDTRFGVAP